VWFCKLEIWLHHIYHIYKVYHMRLSYHSFEIYHWLLNVYQKHQKTATHLQ
jgi:hypothetical protein